MTCSSGAGAGIGGIGGIGGGTVSHPRLAPRRAGVRSWWAKAWQRAVEEAAYAEADLRRGRAHARAGAVGSIAVGAGTFVAAVQDGDDAWTVSGHAAVLDDGARAALVEVVRTESGRVAALLGGDLPLDLAEQAEEAGVELLPYGGELSTTCTCDGWPDPCRHALAVLTVLGWLLDADPLVLLALRGLPRDELLSAVHASGAGTGDGGLGDGLGDDPDTELALDAALRAARALALLDEGGDPTHLL